MTRFLCALFLAITLTSAAQAEQVCPLKGQKPMLVARLFFGKNQSDGGTISDRRWRRFLAKEVTPRFPAGFTVYDAYGQRQRPDTQAVTREKSKVIELATENSATARERLSALMNSYKRLFDQESVGIVTSESCAVF